MYRTTHGVTYYIKVIKRVTQQRLHVLFSIFLTCLKLSYVKTTSTVLSGDLVFICGQKHLWVKSG